MYWVRLNWVLYLAVGNLAAGNLAVGICTGALCRSPTRMDNLNTSMAVTGVVVGICYGLAAIPFHLLL